jgi:two-component system OmpR family sensor kinase
MSGLVEDLLTLARSDRGTIAERVPVDVAEVVDDAVAGLRAAYPHRQVAVTDRGPLVGARRPQPAAAGGHQHPHQRRGARDRPGADHRHRRAGGRRGRGPGRSTRSRLPPEQAAQVFDRFWRADAARTRARGGSGLGMSIVAALVADHGGRVDFESTVEHGTTVTVRLPAARVPAETPVVEAGAAGHGPDSALSGSAAGFPSAVLVPIVAV